MPTQDRAQLYDESLESELDSVRAEVALYRSRIINVWRDRAVMLTPDEQKDLSAEILATGELLVSLIRLYQRGDSDTKGTG